MARVLSGFPPPHLELFPLVRTDYEGYICVELMLHHLHSDFDEPLTIEDETFESYVDAYLHCKTVHAGAHPDDYFNGIDEPWRKS